MLIQATAETAPHGGVAGGRSHGCVETDVTIGIPEMTMMWRKPTMQPKSQCSNRTPITAATTPRDGSRGPEG